MRQLLLTGFLYLFAFCLYAEGTVCQQKQCIAVIDAGSTSSKVHIYAYDLSNNNSPTGITELWSKRVKPGFATLESKQESINSYLDNLFIDAPEKNMKVYFYATAGMRLLSQPKQRSYYALLENWFANNASQWQLSSAKTITGTQEGVFGWLAVNYKLGNLDNETNPLVGVLDMGGASLQISFPVQNTENVDPNDLISLDIANRRIDLFVHSFLGLGQTLLTEQFLNESSCFPNGYVLPSGLEGTGDAYACKDRVRKLINNVHHVDKIVKPIVLNNTPNSWYTISGLATIAQDKPFSFPNRQITGMDLLQQSQTSICKESWNNLYERFGNNEFLYGFCLVPSYYYSVLVDGYGIKPKQTVNYLPSGQSLDWTLGVVFHQS